MTAERHALLATLDFSDDQRRTIQSQIQMLRNLREENRLLREKINLVQHAASGPTKAPDRPQDECRPDPMMDPDSVF